MTIKHSERVQLQEEFRLEPVSTPLSLNDIKRHTTNVHVYRITFKDVKRSTVCERRFVLRKNTVQMTAETNALHSRVHRPHI